MNQVGGLLTFTLDSRGQPHPTNSAQASNITVREQDSNRLPGAKSEANWGRVERSSCVGVNQVGWLINFYIRFRNNQKTTTIFLLHLCT